MKILIFGATGMVGHGVLRECLLDPAVETVVSVSRISTGAENPKLIEILRNDYLNYSGLEDRLSGLDACFYCLGVSSVGMEAEQYHTITYDYTVAAANFLAGLNPGMTFIYVSGAGTDSSEEKGAGWARVKGAVENALFRLPLKAYAFRPGAIVPMHGVRSKTLLYNAIYSALGPALRLLHVLLPRHILTTEQIGRAMLKVARNGAPVKILESPDIAAI